MAFSENGRFVYVSKRGEDTLVAYAMNSQSGLLAELQGIPRKTRHRGASPWIQRTVDAGCQRGFEFRNRVWDRSRHRKAHRLRGDAGGAQAGQRDLSL